MSVIKNFPAHAKPYQATYTNGSGRGRIRKIKSFVSSKDAQLWLKQMETNFINGETYAKSQMLFVDYFQEWYRLYKAPVVSPPTLDSYYNSWRHFKEHGLGHVKMENLTRDKIQTYLNDLAYAKETTRKDLNHLRACLRDAYDDGVISRNPAAGTLHVIADPAKSKSKDRKFMAETDFRKVQDFLLNYNYRLSDVNRAVLLVISQTALRVGEALALRYDDLNQLNCTIRVDESWDAKHLMFGKPKTESGYRTIPVSRQAMKKIITWQNFHRRELFRRGIPNPGNLLFLNRQKNLPRASAINSCYHQLQLRLGIEAKFSTHTMRHTLASILLGSGEVSIQYISYFLGHANVAITQKYYIGLLPEQVEKEDQEVVKIVGAL
ncbi:tyrosine-type recombinase/integrase [Ligilactobacillus acidipiscis]|uniref:Prophage Lp2 protein 2, integrase n=1 Tax=Ligilactobacillus acidipiscis TaxID=89059 RepID=A0A0R2KF49_9LACO|nr:site-specific integrase [Ligilactobacillus acidipiscis]KRN88030.1 prophage Lp2 protein 2, integrase [Ligilactobacillus acidipiscis]